MNTIMALPDTYFQSAYMVVLAFIATFGFVAMVSPKWFRRIESRLNRSVDTSKFQEVMDRPIDIDQYLKQHIRLMGAAFLTVSFCLAWKFI